MQKVKVISFISFTIISIIMIGALILPYITQNSNPKNTNIYIAYKKGASYSYLSKEMEITIPYEGDHTLLPTQYRNREDNFSIEEIPFNASEYKIVPYGGNEEINEEEIKAYKVSFVTNVEPDSYVKLYCNNAEICKIPIINKSIDRFEYETCICLDKKHDFVLYASADSHKSQHVYISKE